MARGNLLWLGGGTYLSRGVLTLAGGVPILARVVPTLVGDTHLGLDGVPPRCEQIENITFPHPSDAGGNHTTPAGLPRSN